MACVVELRGGKRVVVARARWTCQDTTGLSGFRAEQGRFQIVVEATACYEWLVEPLADRVVLAHPRKLPVIAESTWKTDKLDAQLLAEFLALGMIPEAHRPSPTCPGAPDPPAAAMLLAAANDERQE